MENYYYQIHRKVDINIHKYLLEKVCNMPMANDFFEGVELYLHLCVCRIHSFCRADAPTPVVKSLL